MNDAARLEAHLVGVVRRPPRWYRGPVSSSSSWCSSRSNASRPMGTRAWIAHSRVDRASSSGTTWLITLRDTSLGLRRLEIRTTLRIRAPFL